MHFLCSTFGSSGDVFPMLGLCLALRRRGHSVTFATNEHYAGMAGEYGLPFEPLGTETDFHACVTNPDLWRPRRAFRHVFNSLAPALRRQYEIHVERARAGQLVAITNVFGFGALMAQETIGLPVLTLHLQPAVLWSDVRPPSLPGVVGPRWLRSWIYRLAERFIIDPVVGAHLNPWRRELGLPPIRRVTDYWHSPKGVIGMFPEWYAPPQIDWPTPLAQTDFPLWNHRADRPLADEVQRFLDEGDPPLVFTPGSTNLHGRAFFQAAVESCRALGRRGVLLTEFPDQLPTPLPHGVVHFAYVPLDQLLPRSAAFIHHGGIGSASQALLAGIPQMMMPLAHDQFDNWERVRRLGVGDGIPAPRFQGKRLTNGLRRLLESAAVASRCAEVARRLAPRDGLERAAAAAERLLEI